MGSRQYLSSWQRRPELWLVHDTRAPLSLCHAHCCNRRTGRDHWQSVSADTPSGADPGTRVSIVPRSARVVISSSRASPRFRATARSGEVSPTSASMPAQTPGHARSLLTMGEGHTSARQIPTVTRPDPARIRLPVRRLVSISTTASEMTPPERIRAPDTCVTSGRARIEYPAITTPSCKVVHSPHEPQDRLTSKHSLAGGYIRRRRLWLEAMGEEIMRGSPRTRQRNGQRNGRADARSPWPCPLSCPSLCRWRSHRSSSVPLRCSPSCSMPSR